MKVTQAVTAHFGQFWWRNNRKGLVYINLITVMAAVIEMVHCYQIVHESIPKGSKAINTLSMTTISLMERVAMFCILLQSIKARRITTDPSFISCWTRLDTVTSENTRKKSNSITKIAFIYTILATTIQTIVLTAIGRLYLTTNRNAFMFIWTIANFIITVFTTYQFYHFQSCTIVLFYVILLKFQDVVQTMRRHLVGKRVGNGVMTNISLIHQDLCDIVRYANGLISPAMLSILTSGVITLASVTYRTWANDINDGVRTATIGVYYTVNRLVPLFIMCEVGHRLTKQFRAGSDPIYGIISCSNSDDRLQLLLLESKLRKGNLNISASGYISINRKLIYHIIAFIYTYSTMMIQFAKRK